MRGELRVIRGRGVGRRFRIPEVGRLVLGRAAACEIRFDDPAVSARHCAIEWSGGAHLVQDLDSHNGTFLNGEKVRRRSLAPGDVLAVGGTALEYAVVTAPVLEPESGAVLLGVDSPWSPDRAVLCRVLPVREPAFWADLARPGGELDAARLVVVLPMLFRLYAPREASRSLAGPIEEALDCALAALSGCRAAVAVLLPREPGFPGLHVARALDPRDGGEPVAVSRTILDACLREGVCLLTSVPPGSSGTDSMAKTGIRSVLCAPLESSLGILGALYVDSRSQVETFDPADVAMLAALAAAVAALTERWHLEARLESVVHRFEDVLHHVPVAIFATDPGGKLALWNRECERLLGHSAGAVLGRDGLELLLGDAARGAVERADAGAESPVEQEFRGADGRRIHGALALRRFFDLDGSPSGHIGYLVDLHELRAVHAVLARTERIATLGLLVAGISHDFKNILTKLALCTDLVALPPEQLETAEGVVRRAVGQGLALCETLLAHAQRKQDRLEPTDLARLLDETIGLAASEFAAHGLSVQRAIEPVGMIEANPGLLQSVFLNLLLNARQALPKGGRLSVSLRREGEDVKIAFVDDGPGIPLEVLATLFQPLVTTKDGSDPAGGGAGLGLYMSAEIVRRHGGEISCISSPGKGTTFTVRLPIGTAAARAGGACPATSFDRAVVLAITEERRLLWLELFRERPERVLTDPVRVVDLVRSEEIDVAFLDLPPAGTERAIQLLRAARPALRIAVVLGRTSEDAASFPVLRGADGYLHPPFGRDEVLRCIPVFPR
ncbi:MAG: FHA domain-containing protein [Planctomycetes bacterium]|nr:FHA domain-containing protein [Planctomycetota bacterium]